MINLFFTIIRYFILYLCCFYGYIKLANIKFRLLDLICIPVALLLATGIYYATNKMNILIPSVFVASSLVYFLIRYQKPSINLFTFGTISCGFSISSMIIPSLISFPLNLVIFALTKNDPLRDCLSLLLQNILQITISITIYKSKRLQSGFSTKKDG